MNSSALENKFQILTWTIADQLYGAEIHYCFEVQNNTKIIEVPHSQPFISGIVNLRGDVVTVLDLLVLMGQRQESNTDDSVIIRLKNKEKQVAIKADSISEVRELNKESLEPAGVHLTEEELRYIPYVTYTDAGLILILNVEELFVVK